MWDHHQRAAVLGHKRQGCPAPHCSLHQTSRTRELKKSHIPYLFWFVFKGQTVLHHHKMLAVMWPNTPVLVFILFHLVILWRCYFSLFLWMALWCGNCTEPQILDRVVKITKEETHLSLLSVSSLSSFCTILFNLYCFHTFLVCVSGVCVLRHSNIACKWTASFSWLGIELPLFRPWPLPSLPGLPSPAEWQWSWATEEAQAGEYDREQAVVNMDGDAAGEVWVVFLEGKVEEESHWNLDSGTTACLSLRWQRRKACRCAEPRNA